MAIVPFTSTNQAGATIFFQRHSQSGEGDADVDAVLSRIGVVDENGAEFGSALQTKALLTATGTISASGDNIAIDISAQPGYTAGDRGVISAIRIQNESGNNNLILIKNGTTTIARIFTSTAGSGIDRQYTPGRELRLSIDTDLILNTSASDTVGYSVEFFLE